MERFRAIVLIEVWGGAARDSSTQAPAADLEKEESVQEVLTSLSKISTNGKYYHVFGQSDIIAVLEAVSMKEMWGKLQQIRGLRKIRLTVTLPVTQVSLPGAG